MKGKLERALFPQAEAEKQAAEQGESFQFCSAVWSEIDLEKRKGREEAENWSLGCSALLELLFHFLEVVVPYTVDGDRETATLLGLIFLYLV